MGTLILSLFLFANVWAGQNNDLTCARAVEVLNRIATHHHAISLGGPEAPVQKWRRIQNQPTFQKNFVDALFSGLDPEHILFTKADVEFWKPFLEDGYHRGFQQKNDCSLYQHILNTYALALARLHLPDLKSVLESGEVEKWAETLSPVDEENPNLVLGRGSWASSEQEQNNRLLLAVAFRYRKMRSEPSLKDVSSKVLVQTAYMHTIKTIHVERLNETHPADFPDRILQASLQSLDPYTNFTPSEGPKETGSDRNTTQNFYLGLGFSGQWITYEGVMLQTLSSDGPIAKAGLKPGDVILGVNDQVFFSKAEDDITTPLRCSEVDEKKSLRVRRESQEFVAEVRCARLKNSDLNPKTFDISILKTEEGDDVLYIQVFEVNDGIFVDIVDAITQIRASRLIRGYVINLRGNPGGHNMDSWDLSSIFLKGNLELRMVHANGTIEGDFQSRSDLARDYAFTEPMVILTDSSTASAAEHIAGNLQDFNRAIVVSENAQTYGKGSSYTSFYDEDLGFKDLNLGKFVLSNGFYYLPSGRSPQLTGIAPDVLVGNTPYSKIPLMKDLAAYLPTPAPIERLIPREWIKTECRQKFLKELTEAPQPTGPVAPGMDPVLSSGLRVVGEWIRSPMACMHEIYPQFAEAR